MGADGHSMIGVAPGWRLIFPDVPGLRWDQDDYYARIDATLTSGLAGGAYAFDILGMTDEDYVKLKSAQAASGPPLKVRLHLYWRDAQPPVAVPGSLAGADDDVGLVAVLAVTGVSRAIQGLRYVTTIKAREMAYHRLAGARLTQAVSDKSPTDAAKGVLKALGFGEDEVSVHPFASTTGSGGVPVSEAPRGMTGVNALSSIGEAIEQQSGRYGRGAYLIRDGRVHVGAGRPVPLSGAPTSIGPAEGLVGVTSRASVSRDPYADLSLDAAKTQADSRNSYELKLRGMPSIKPGDLVQFQLPPEEVEAKGGFYGGLASAVMSVFAAQPSGAPTTLYVTDVVHALSKDTGFLSSVIGVVVDPTNPADLWDSYTSHGSDVHASRVVAGAGAEDQLAQAIHAISGARARWSVEVGEVRAFQAATGGDAPRQTETVIRGLKGSDGAPRQSARLDLERVGSTHLEGVPYLTPFAWGPFGLVLPRYPGARVALTHRNGAADDPIDIGALWAAPSPTQAVAPNGAKAGDWWLTLPAGVTAGQPGDAKLNPPIEPPADAKASNDLTDADGGRVIEVAQFVIRVGKAALHPAGERPQPPDKAQSLTIEHKDGASRIVIDKDGGIEIVAGKGLKITAGEDVEISGKNIKLKVSGGGKVDVTQ